MKDAVEIMKVVITDPFSDRFNCIVGFAQTFFGRLMADMLDVFARRHSDRFFKYFGRVALAQL